MLRSVIFALLVPVGLQAEPHPDVAGLMAFTEGIAPCLDGAVARGQAEACQDTAALACMDGSAQGQTTVGMMLCVMAETHAWDVLLNREYQAVLERARSLDRADTPEYALRADRLRDAQRAWITFRDAECALARSEFGSGSMSELSGSACLADLTAQRTIDLKFLMQIK